MARASVQGPVEASRFSGGLRRAFQRRRAPSPVSPMAVKRAAVAALAARPAGWPVACPRSQRARVSTAHQAVSDTASRRARLVRGASAGMGSGALALGHGRAALTRTGGEDQNQAAGDGECAAGCRAGERHAGGGARHAGERVGGSGGMDQKEGPAAWSYRSRSAAQPPGDSVRGHGQARRQHREGEEREADPLPRQGADSWGAGTARPRTELCRGLMTPYSGRRCEGDPTEAADSRIRGRAVCLRAPVLP